MAPLASLPCTLCIWACKDLAVCQILITYCTLHQGASPFVMRITGNFIMATFIASIREMAPDCARTADHHFSFLFVRLKINNAAMGKVIEMLIHIL